MNKIISTLIALVVVSSVYAQNLKEQVKTLFENDENIEFQYFRGRMNDINDIVIALGKQGTAYKGVFKYMRSKEMLTLEGQKEDDILVLTEKDSTNTITGHISVTINEFDEMTGEWYNHNRTVAADLKLISYLTEPKYPTYCGDNKWIRIYKGTINKEAVELILERGRKNQLDGLVWFQNNNKTYKVEGFITQSDGEISLHFQDENWVSKGDLEGKINASNDNHIMGLYTIGSLKDSCTLRITQQFSVGCIEYADYLSLLDALYPKTTNATFNEGLKSKIDDWIKFSRVYKSDFEKQLPNTTPEQRLSLRSYLWYDAAYLSDDILSFIFTFSNTWEDEFARIAYNFDLKNNKEITLKDLFIEGSGYNAIIYSYIRQDLKKRPYYADPMFQEWAKDIDFEFFTIRKDGLHFTTPFNSIFGEQHCTIPYKDLKSFFKRDNPISHLVNTGD